ncbi:MAG: hypothetical protein LAO51_16485 [Acidobacteriia bacterium]|nr:hypothetical protein [Terriglobia bacterium]
MTTKEKIHADATAYIDPVIKQNQKFGMGSVSKKEVSDAVRQAEEAAHRVLCQEES